MGQIEWPAIRRPLARERVYANTRCLLSHARKAASQEVPTHDTQRQDKRLALGARRGGRSAAVGYKVGLA